MQPLVKPIPVDKPLTPKQQRFVEEFLVDFSATNAARRAGYSPRSAPQTGISNMLKANVVAAINRHRGEIAKKNELTVERVLEEYRRLAFAITPDMIGVKNGYVTIQDTDDLTDDQKAAIAEIHQTKDGVRVKFHSKTAALDGLAKYFGLFQDTNVNVNLGLPPPQIVLMPAARPAIEGNVIDVEPGDISKVDQTD